MEPCRTNLVNIIFDLGVASEVELQVKTMCPLGRLRDDLKKLEDEGVIRRKPKFFDSAYGDGLELTPKGLKSFQSAWVG